MSNLDQVLDAAMGLPLEQQEMLIKILQNRIHENIRDEIAKDAKDSIAEFKTGAYQAQTAKEVIQELRESLR